MVQVVPEAEASWVLRQVTPTEARAIFGLPGVEGERVLLFQGERRLVTDAERKEALERLQAAGKRSLQRIYGGYPVADAKALVLDLERDLQKVFKVQNLWRVSGTLGGNAVLAPDHGLRFEVVRLKDKNDRQGEELRSPTITPGTMLSFRVGTPGRMPCGSPPCTAMPISGS
jgi:hypothetical protein